MADKSYLCWETDDKFEPTGEYKILNAPTAKWAAEHLKYTLQGSFKFPTSRCFTIVLPNKKEWHVRHYRHYERIKIPSLG